MAPFLKVLLSHLHCIVEGLSKIGWNAPGTLHFKRKRKKEKRRNSLKRIIRCSKSPLCRMVPLPTDSQQQIFQVSRCFPLNGLLHLVSGHLHVGVKHWNAQYHSVSVSYWGAAAQRLPASLRHTPFLRCSGLRFPRTVTNVCSSVPNFSSPALKRILEHRKQKVHITHCFRLQITRFTFEWQKITEEIPSPTITEHCVNQATHSGTFTMKTFLSGSILFSNQLFTWSFKMWTLSDFSVSCSRPQSHLCAQNNLKMSHAH